MKDENPISYLTIIVFIFILIIIISPVYFIVNANFNTFLKVLFIGLNLGLLAFFLLWVAIVNSYGNGFFRKATPKILIMSSNYQVHKEQINNLVQYFNKISPTDKTVSIENKKGAFLSLSTVEKTSNYAYYPSQSYDLSIYKNNFYPHMLQQLASLQWTIPMFNELNLQFWNARINKIESGNPVKLYYKHGDGIYLYFIKSLTIEEVEKYKINPHYAVYNQHLIFERSVGNWLPKDKKLIQE